MANGTTRATCGCASIPGGRACRAGGLPLFRDGRDGRCKTGDVDYQSALLSIWQNIADKRDDIIGGIGSGETSGGVSARITRCQTTLIVNRANCGLLFFEEQDNLSYARLRLLRTSTTRTTTPFSATLTCRRELYLYERARFHENRYPWHGALLRRQHPADAAGVADVDVSTSKDSIYVNMYAGSKVNVGEVAGTKVEIEQKTGYPWASGKVTIIVRPEKQAKFSYCTLRIPDREFNPLYSSSPTISRFAFDAMQHTTISSDLPTEGHTSIKEDYIAWSAKLEGGRRDFV